MPDCLANSYLQLASILAAGMDNKMPLTIKESTHQSKAPMPDELKAELGVNEKLPRDLEGLDILKGDAEIFKKALGVKCFDAYVAIAEVEEARRKTRGEKRLALEGP